MKKLLGVLILLLLLFPALPACGETYSVSPGELTQALAAAADGDVIELSDGVYDGEAFPITVSRSVTLRAAQGAQPIIDAPAFQSALRVEADGVCIEGLTIQFRRTGLYLLGNDFTATDCTIALADPAWRTSSCGAWFGGIYRATLRNCAFTECGIAMAGPPLSQTSHLVPVLTGLFEVGEDRAYFTTHEITDCTVNGKPLFYAHGQEQVVAPSDAGEVLVADCGQVLVENADVSYASMGMEIVYCDHVRVEHSKADWCGVFGIYFAKVEQGEMVACSAEGTNHGLDVRASSNISLLECSANGCDQGLFFSRVDNGLMKDCVVSHTGQGYFLAGGDRCQLLNCQAIGCENGFNIQKEQNVLVSGCTLQGCTICAARLDGSPTVFADNLLEDNWVGVMAYGPVSFDLVGNRITGSGSCGLYLRDIGYSRITGNTITGESSCIEASGEMRGSLLTDNLLEGALKLSPEVQLRQENNSFLTDCIENPKE